MRFSVDGYEIDYELRGAGRPIVLLHGLTTDRRVMTEAFEPQFERATLGQRIYLDLPGHGASRGDPTHASADILVSVVAALLRSLTDRPPLVVGYSYGGYLAQGLVGELSVAGLFLLCPVTEPDFGKRSPAPRRIAVREAELRFSDDPREREAFEEVAVVQTNPLLQTFQRAIHPANISVDSGLVSAIRKRYALARPFMQSLTSLDVPISIVCGRDDHWVGFRDGFTLAERCPTASYRVITNAGHLLPFEAPVPFAEAVAEWISRCRALFPPAADRRP